MDAPTISTLLRTRAAATPAAIAYVELKAGRTQRSMTWGEFQSRVERLASSLSALGLGAGDRVAIFAPNSIDWETAQHGSFACGAMVGGVDPNYPPDQLSEVLRHLRPTVVFAQDISFLERLDGMQVEALKLASIFSLDRKPSPGRTIHMDDLLNVPSRTVFEWSRASVDVGGVIAFSSGTTGDPKPITFTHAQIREGMRAIIDAFPDIGQGERLLCWLPLSHLFQRMINFCAVDVAAISYLTDDPRTVVNHLKAVKPRVFVGVPRFFERVHSETADKLRREVWPIRKVAEWAISCGHRCASASRAGQSVPIADRLARLVADRLVLSRIRGVFGGHAKYMVSGSAPMPRWLLEWFDAIGLPAYEVYGVSENIVPIAVNRPGQRKLGTVGKPLARTEVKVAPDGEILVRGPGVFKGYMIEREGLPRPGADGFWPTGDLGSLDPDGFLSIHGRKSDTFKTSTGRWISPTKIEACLARIPYIEHAVVVGRGRKAPVAILRLGDPVPPMTRHDAEKTLPKKSDDILVADLEQALDSVPPRERPAGVLIVGTAFSVTGGELTTNLKLRRAEVERKYAAEIERLYQRLDQASANTQAASPRLLVDIA